MSALQLTPGNERLRGCLEPAHKKLWSEPQRELGLDRSRDYSVESRKNEKKPEPQQMRFGLSCPTPRWQHWQLASNGMATVSSEVAI
jgi:hypothetical protein